MLQLEVRRKQHERYEDGCGVDRGELWFVIASTIRSRAHDTRRTRQEFLGFNQCSKRPAQPPDNKSMALRGLVCLGGQLWLSGYTAVDARCRSIP